MASAALLNSRTIPCWSLTMIASTAVSKIARYAASLSLSSCTTAAHLALQDEARHVAFGQAHLEHRVEREPALRDRLQAAMERRHDALASTAGLNADVFDALVVLAAGAWSAPAVAAGWERVQELQVEMDEGRQRRLVRLGFPADEAQALSALHTRNFM